MLKKLDKIRLYVVFLFIAIVGLSCDEKPPEKMKFKRNIKVVKEDKRPQDLIIKKETIENKKWYLSLISLTNDFCELKSIGNKEDEIYLNRDSKIRLSNNYDITSSEWQIQEDTITIKIIGKESPEINTSKLEFSIKNRYKIVRLTTEKMTLKKTKSYYEQIFHYLWIE